MYQEDNISPRTIRRGANLMIASLAVWAVFGTLFAGPILSGMMLTLNFSDPQIGFMLSLASLVLPIQLVGSIVQDKFFHRKKFGGIAGIFQYSIFGLMGVTIAFWDNIPTIYAIVFLMSCYGLSQALSQARQPSNLAWQAALVPPNQSASFWSRRAGISSLCTMTAGVLMGALVDYLGRDRQITYVVAIGIGTIFGFYSLYLNQCAVDPDPEPHRDSNVLQLLKETWGNRQFRILTYFFAFQAFSGAIGGTFIFVYLQQTMNLTMTQIQIFAAIGSLVGFFSAYIFTVIGTKFGRKPILMICTLLKFAELMIWASLLPKDSAFDIFVREGLARFGIPALPLPPGCILLIPCYIIGGFANMGLAAGQLSLVTSVGTRRIQSFAIALFYAFLGIGGFISGSMSGVLIEKLNQATWVANLGVYGFTILIFISGVGFLLSMIFLLPFREDGASPTRDVIRILLSGNPIRSIYQAHVLSRPMSEMGRVETLRHASGQMVAREFIQGLQSPSSRVRDSALISLSHTDKPLSPGLIEELLNLTEETDLGLQSMAIRVLGRQKIREAVPKLCELFHNSDRTIAQSAVFAVGLIGDHRAEEPLIKIIGDRKMSHLHPEAAESLSKIGDHTSIRRIFEILERQINPILYRSCLISLCRLMQEHKHLPHSIFDSEEKLNGSEVERLIRAVARHELWGRVGIRVPSATKILSYYDRGMFLECIESFLLGELALCGITPEKEIPPGQFINECFLPGGKMRYTLLSSNEYCGVSLWLQLKLWAEIRYNPENKDRFLLLTVLFAANMMLDEKFRELYPERNLLAETLNLM